MVKETVKVDVEEVKLKPVDKMAEKKKNKDDKKDKKTKKTEKKASKNKENYFKKVMAEMKLVTWPTRKQVVKYSIATILMVAFLAVFFIGVSALFDLLYGFVQGWLG